MHSLLRQIADSHELCFRYFALIGRCFAKKNLQERRFPSAVRPYKPDAIMRTNAKRDLVEKSFAAVLQR
jgi:hypothetical protein